VDHPARAPAMKLDREINTMLLMSMSVNLHVLNDEKDRLSDRGQMSLDMLAEDFGRLVDKLTEGSK
jgi:hypothetical protein